MKTFFILSLLLTVARFQEIPRCEMAIQLTFHQLDGHLDLTLAQWVCNALYIPEREYEKGTRMQSTVRSEIQMKRNSPNGCGRRCNEFINNNLADSILHSKRVVIPQGRISKRHLRYDCENMDLTHFLDDCDLQMDYTIADTKVKSGD